MAASKGCHAHFEIAGDVLDDHDGVVHHKAGCDGERHQREVVDGVAQQVHDAEGAHQRERHGYRRDNGGPHLAQEEEDHQHHQQTLMPSEISTSRTLERMVVVRSTATSILMVGGMAACRRGISAITRPRWR
jgi:hypothetical protein